MHSDDEIPDHRLSLKAIGLLRDRLWPYMRRHKPSLFGALAFVLVSTICSLLTPWLLGYAVDHVLVPKQLGLVLPFASLLLGTDVLRSASLVFQNVLMMKFGQSVMHDLRQDLLRQYEFYPMAELNRTPIGKLVTRLVNDTSSLQDLFSGGFAVVLGEIAMVVGILGWLIVLHPSLGLVCVSIFPLMLVASNVFGKKIRETYRQTRAALSRLNANLAENIAGMSLIQIFNGEKRFRARFDGISSAFTRTSLANVEAFALLQPSITIVSSLSMSLLIWYGGYASLRGTVTLGLLVAFMSYLQSLYAPIRDITEKYNLFVSAMISCERIFEFMDRKPEIGTDPLTRHVAKLDTRGRIEFRNVWFRYGEELPWVLRDVSFTLEPGTQVGIVGHTGAGKTTLSALLMRFYDVSQGAILLDGVDLRKLDKRALRQAIGYIQQDPFLFSGTIEDNILLWEEARREHFEALPAAAHEGLRGFSLDLKKEVFEKGANLSAGQKQVISFLRALTQNPPVLILDEATAHVDLRTENWIGGLSQQAFASRTVLVIAHRLATLKKVGRILVLHHGQLVEHGTHHELLSSPGIYRRLYEIQSRREELL